MQARGVWRGAAANPTGSLSLIAGRDRRRDRTSRLSAILLRFPATFASPAALCADAYVAARF
jgi:hypothetical protein